MQRETKKTKFDPHATTTAEIAAWIRAGDFEEAKNLGRELAMFLGILAENKKAQLEMMKAGVPWIGADLAALIAERLLDDPTVNKEAHQQVVELLKAGHRKGSDKLTKAVERLKQAPSVGKGKTRKTGVELFAKMLIPNKPTKSQFEARWLATVADLNLENTTKSEYQRLASMLNEQIERNNRIMADWRNGKTDNHDGWRPSLPARRITRDQLEKAHRKFKDEIAAANGVRTHKMGKSLRNM